MRSPSYHLTDLIGGGDPDTRLTAASDFRGIGYTATVGFKVDPTGVIGEPGELFLDCHKSSSDLTSLARDAAVSISLALQHGCRLETLAGAMTRIEDGKPARHRDRARRGK